jgi:hypothetical protein
MLTQPDEFYYRIHAQSHAFGSGIKPSTGPRPIRRRQTARRVSSGNLWMLGNPTALSSSAVYLQRLVRLYSQSIVHGVVGTSPTQHRYGAQSVPARLL